MPIRPPAITYLCPDCQWTKTVQPRSDVLMPSDFIEQCPRCASTELQAQPASSLDAVTSVIKEKSQRLLTLLKRS